ncbi:MAG: BamA/TamA family outer membrane protein [Chitinophagales bacterium]
MCCLFSAMSCTHTRHLPEGKTLHKTTLIDFKSDIAIKDKSDLKEQLYNLSRPKPNAKFLGIGKVKLWIYNRTRNAKKGLGEWLRRNLGQPPVLIDSTLLDRSQQVMALKLQKKGYFQQNVSYETVTKNRSTSVTYKVSVEKPYRIDSIFLPTDTATNPIAKVIQEIKWGSYLQTNDQFDADVLQQERIRITQYLRNNGYYNFSSNFIHYDLDSSKINRSIKVYLKVKQASNGSHTPYRIGKVFVYTQHNPKDTLFNYPDTTFVNGYYFITPAARKFKPQAIVDHLLLKQGKLYSQNDYQNTINRLFSLGVFKFVTIGFTKDTIAENQLNTFIRLVPSVRQGVSTNMEVNNQTASAFASSGTGGLLGIAVGGTYRNKNTFKGAEALNLNLYYGQTVNIGNNTNSDNPRNNINEFSGEAVLSLPKFLAPKRFHPKVSNQNRPTTNIRIGFGRVESANQFTITSYNLAYGYTWREQQELSRNQHLHTFSPLSISSVNVTNTTPSFDEYLQQNPRQRLTFQPRIIVGPIYSYSFTNQDLNQRRDFDVFRGTIEVAGAGLSNIEQLLRANNITDSLKIFGIDYAQFARVEADFRKYKMVTAKSELVSRIATGLVIPYGNSDAVPFVKRFSIGGPNSLRAFQLGRLGPGTTNLNLDTTNVKAFRRGDIRIEANVEYRFPIWKYLKGALFVDAGNVWTLREENETTGGLLSFKDFWGSLGLGTGVGTRLDFGYFVLRLDFGYRLRDPRQPAGERWVADRNIVTWQFGIGYPF